MSLFFYLHRFREVRSALENANLGKRSLTRPQAPREWRNRTHLDECYVFNVVIPPKDEFGTNRRRALDKTTATTSREISILLPRVFGGDPWNPSPSQILGTTSRNLRDPSPSQILLSTFSTFYFLWSYFLWSRFLTSCNMMDSGHPGSGHNRAPRLGATGRIY